MAARRGETMNLFPLGTAGVPPASARRVPALPFVCQLLATALAAPAVADVTVAEDAATYTLTNRVVTARIAKASGDLVSLRYQNREMLATFLRPDGEPDLEKDPPGANPNGLNRGFTDHQYGFWSHDAMGPRDTGPAIARITIDPNANGGARAEVSVKGISRHRKMGTGPGAPPTGQFAADVEIRYTLGRDEPGVYTYCIFEHAADYPASGIGEARFCAKLAPMFDWMSVSQHPHRNKHYPKELREGDKYVYTVVQWENPAFGWSSTSDKVGFYILNASMEYMSGGPTKVEFQGHRDTNAVAAPCVLNYWRSSHYGGAEVNIAAGEHWQKVIGPFLLYVNSGPDPQAMFDDAKARQRKEAAAWPYDWVAGVDYPRRAERSTVKGRVTLDDPAASTKGFSRILIGLTAADYLSPRLPPPGGGEPPRINVTWQTDAKHYQFWAAGKSDGSFEIPNVRPGRYTLRAIADGVLGEFARADISVHPGQTLDLKAIAWRPVRRGRQLWEVGRPNRNASEFAGAEAYWEPEISLQYPRRFPNDVNFVIGQSDVRRDWFFQHVPHNEDPAAKALPFRGVTGSGRATPYTVTFDLPAAVRGKATLRLAICGGGARELGVTVNGQLVGKLERLTGDGTIARHGIQGIWYEREIVFDAALLNPGANALALTIPAGPINNGLMYDYLRLELDESGHERPIQKP